MSEQLLHRPNVRPAFEQVGRERVPKRMTAHPLGQTGGPSGLRDSSLNHRLMQVKPRRWPEPLIATDASGRKHKLPRPVGGCVGELARQRVRQRDATEPGCHIRPMLPPHGVQMRREERPYRFWQHDSAIHTQRARETLPGCRPVCHSGRADGGIDSARRTSAPRPSATARDRSRAWWGAWQAAEALQRRNRIHQGQGFLAGRFGWRR